MKTFFLTIGILTSLSVSGYLWLSKSPGPSKQKDIALEQPSAKNKISFDYPVLCKKNTTLTYNQSYKSSGRLDSKSQQADIRMKNVSTSIEHDGILYLRCEKQMKEKLVFLAQLKLEHFSQQGHTQFTYSQDELQHAFRVHLDQKKGLTQLDFDKATSTHSRFVLLDMLSHMSFKWLRAAHQPFQWSSEENLNSGKVKFKNTLHRSAASWSLQKRFLQPPQNTKYESVFQFENGNLREFNLQFEQKTSFNKDTTVSNKTTFQARYEGQSQKAISIAETESVNIEDFLKSGIKTRIYRNELGTLTAMDMLSKVNELEDERSIPELFKKYKALFYLEKSSIPLFKDALSLLSHDDDKYQLLCLAMIKAGHPSIQEFLFDHILEKPGISPQKKIVTFGLMGMLDRPTPVSVDRALRMAQKGQIRDVRKAAWLSATNMGRKAESYAPESYKKVVKALDSKSKRDKLLTEKLDSVHAIGNLGSDKHLPILNKRLERPDLTIKQAALLSMRFMSPEVSQPILIKHINDNGDNSLAMTALESAAFQELTPELLDHLLKTAKSSTRENLRLGSLQLLKQKHAESPARIRRALDDAAKTDDSLRIRQFASSLILSL